MERKKDLNIWLLVLSLITIITILLPFAKTLTISEDLSLWIKIVFYGTIAVFIICLAIIAIVALLSLIKDQYRPIKFIEFCVLLGFFMVFVNIIVFACCGQKLTPGYAVMALEAFLMSAFSQSGRLFSAFPGFGKDLLSLFKNVENLVDKKKEKKKAKELAKAQKEENEINVELPEPEVEIITTTEETKQPIEETKEESEIVEETVEETKEESKKAKKKK